MMALLIACSAAARQAMWWAREAESAKTSAGGLAVLNMFYNRMNSVANETALRVTQRASSTMSRHGAAGALGHTQGCLVCNRVHTIVEHIQNCKSTSGSFRRFCLPGPPHRLPCCCWARYKQGHHGLNCYFLKLKEISAPPTLKRSYQKEVYQKEVYFVWSYNRWRHICMCDVFRKLTSYFVVIINTKRLYCPFYGRKERRGKETLNTIST